MRRFWDLISRYAAPFAAIAVLLALVLTVWSAQDTRSLGRCVDTWAASYVAVANQRAAAHDAVQNSLDTLIRDVPTTNSPTAAANFESALSAYIAASNAARLAEKQHPLPAAPTLDC